MSPTKIRVVHEFKTCKNFITKDENLEIGTNHGQWSIISKIGYQIRYIGDIAAVQYYTVDTISYLKIWYKIFVKCIDIGWYLKPCK